MNNIGNEENACRKKSSPDLGGELRIYGGMTTKHAWNHCAYSNQKPSLILMVDKLVMWELDDGNRLVRAKHAIYYDSI